MLFVPASLDKDAENTTLSLWLYILQVTVKTMSNAACIDHDLYVGEKYWASDLYITNNMICAAAPGKDFCEVRPSKDK